MGFIITVTSNVKWAYLVGTIVFLAGGVGSTIYGFASGKTGVGIMGIAIAVASAVLLIDAIVNIVQS